MFALSSCKKTGNHLNVFTDRFKPLFQVTDHEYWSFSLPFPGWCSTQTAAELPEEADGKFRFRAASFAPDRTERRDATFGWKSKQLTEQRQRRKVRQVEGQRGSGVDVGLQNKESEEEAARLSGSEVAVCSQEGKERVEGGEKHLTPEQLTYESKCLLWRTLTYEWINSFDTSTCTILWKWSPNGVGTLSCAECGAIDPDWDQTSRFVRATRHETVDRNPAGTRRSNSHLWSSTEKRRRTSPDGVVAQNLKKHSQKKTAHWIWDFLSSDSSCLYVISLNLVKLNHRYTQKL